MPTSPKPSPTARKPAKATFAKKQEQRKQLLIWGVVAVAVVGIVFLAMSAPREKRLTCSSSRGSLTAFGSCTAE